MKAKIIKSLTIVFILASLIFIAVGIYALIQVSISPLFGRLAKNIFLVLFSFCLIYGFLSFVIMALILREIYKIFPKHSQKMKKLKID